MSTNARYAFALNEDQIDPHLVNAAERVQFSVKKNGVSVSAAVPVEYFDLHVLPIITDLLSDFSRGRGDDSRRSGDDNDVDSSRRKHQPSVRDLVEILGASSGPELLKAAAVSLSIIQDTPVFTREKLILEAEKAVGHWQKRHSKSVNAIIDYLFSSGCLVETLNGDICLSPAEEKAALKNMRNRTS